MNRLIPLLVGLLAALSASCVSQLEHMVEGADTKRYTYHYGQIGGQGTAQSSMGTAVAFDGQKSFADFMQFAATYYTLSAATKQLLYREVTKRLAAKEITARQAIAANAAIAQSATGAELQIALASIVAGQ